MCVYIHVLYYYSPTLVVLLCHSALYICTISCHNVTPQYICIYLYSHSALHLYLYSHSALHLYLYSHSALHLYLYSHSALHLYLYSHSVVCPYCHSVMMFPLPISAARLWAICNRKTLPAPHFTHRNGGRTCVATATSRSASTRRKERPRPLLRRQQK